MRHSFASIRQSFHNQESWLNVWVFKYFTMPMVYVIVNYTKITPNIISIISLLLGLASAYYFFIGHELIAVVLFLISYLFDAIDGKVARLTKTGKPYGAWMDIFIDRIILVFISTAIAYNYFVETNDNKLLILNSILLGLVFIGSESRHQINMHKAKIKTQESEPNSNYKKWCKAKGLVYEPISLVEVIIFYLIIAPLLGIEFYASLVVIAFLILRLLKQQLYWIKLKA